MKRIIALLSILVLISFGCSEQSSVVSPQVDNNQSFIELPATANSLQKTYSFEEDINGSRGGSLSFFVNNLGNDDGYTVKGDLYVPRKAFNGRESISAVVDDQVAAVDFYPSPFSFNKELYYSVFYVGIAPEDLQGNIDFGYMSANGFVPVQYDQLVVIPERGILGVVGARIDHFSRFGFTR